MPEWEYVPEGWAYQRRHAEIKGWNVADILEIHKRGWTRFVAMALGSGPLGMTQEIAQASPDDINVHNTYMSFAYALALAAQGRDALSMLDWGGGEGHYYLLAQALFPSIRLEYHSKDVPVLAAYGRHLFPDQHFYTDESCLDRSYDLVMASSSLHYSEDWRGTLAGLARATGGYFYLTRQPIVRQVPSYVFIQRPYAYGYNTEYLGWCLNRDELIAETQYLGLTLVREMIIGERPNIVGAPEACQYGGFLFHARPVEKEGHERVR